LMNCLENPKISKASENELRLLCAEIEYRRKVNPLQFYVHLPQQQSFHDDPATSKVLFGANRAGKTSEAAEYIITRALAKPRQRIWACSETFADSVNILQRKIWEIVPKNQIDYGHYDDINGFTNRKLRLKNKSLIIMKSYDQGVMSFASDDCDLIAFDEEPPYDIYKECRMRLIDRNGEMILSMTSVKGVTDLIADIYDNCDIKKTRYSEFLNEDLPIVAEKNGVRFYFIWSQDNPYINQNRLREEIKLMTRDEIKSRIHGIPINLSGRIYKFNSDVHVVPFDFVPRNRVCIYNILDPHDRKPWAMAWVALTETGTAYLIDEWPNEDFNTMIDHNTYDSYAEIIRRKEETICKTFNHSVYRRIIDPNYGNKAIRLAATQDSHAHTTIKDELKRRGFIYQDGVDALEEGHLKVREKLHYEEIGKEIVKQPAFFVVEGCQNTIRHLSRYSRKDINTADGDVKDNAKPQEKYKDFCDLVRYFWMSNPKCILEKRTFNPETPRRY